MKTGGNLMARMLTDRRATRRERSSLNAYRRKHNIAMAVLAERLEESHGWIWDRLSEKSLGRTVYLSELRRIRGAIDEIVQTSRGGR